MKKYLCIILWCIAHTFWFVQGKGSRCIPPQLPKYSFPITREEDSYEDNSMFYYRCQDTYHFKGLVEHHKVVCAEGHWQPVDFWKCFDDCNNRCGDHGACMKTVGINTSETVTSCECQKNYAGPQCDLRVCDSMPIAQHHYHPYLKSGNIIEDKYYSLGSIIEYRCVHNYHINSRQSTARCESTGWNPSTVPRCEVTMMCDGDSFPDGVHNPMKEKYKPDESVAFSCYRGFVLQGEPKVVCKHGFWSPGWPSCVPLCEQQPFRYGRFTPMKNSYRTGESVRFICNLGYKLDVNTTLCTSSGAWYPPWPTCRLAFIDDRCTSPPIVQHGQIIQRGTDRVGESVTYSCLSNYLMEGKSTIFCQSFNNKQAPTWEQAPRCDMTCGDGSKVMKKKGNKYYCETKPVITTTVTSTVKPLTIVTATAGALLLLLLIVISLVAYQRRRIAINSRRQGRERIVNEDDRYSFVYYSNDVHVVLPSYDEAMRVQGAPPPYRLDAIPANATIVENVTDQDVPTAIDTNQSTTEVIYDAIDETLLNSNYIQGQRNLNEPHSSTTHSSTSNETNEHNNTTSTDRQTDIHNSNVLSKDDDAEMETDVVTCVNNRENNVLYTDNHSIDSASSFSFVCDTTQLIED